MNADQVIIEKEQQLLALIQSGKLEFTGDELASYLLEVKRKDDKGGFGTTVKVTVPEFGLGPVDPARLRLAARLIAGALGCTQSLKGGRYVFSRPSGKTVITTSEVKVVEVPGPERIVEKIVEKIVEVRVPADKTEAGEVQFPQAPSLPVPKGDYIRPAWYRRLKDALDVGKHVSIAGPPGGGKSTGPEQYFIERGQKFVVVNGDAGFRRRDMEGSTEVNQGTTFFRVAEFAAAAINGWGCILNEVNAADPDALMYINGLLEVPFQVNVHGKAYPVHPDFRLVVTYNPGLIGTKALPQAFKDRFFPIKLGFPPSVFLHKLLTTKGMPKDAGYAERLCKFAQEAWKLHEKGTLRYQISPRRLFDVVFLIEGGEMFDDAVKQAVVDAVDSFADAQILTTLITSSARDIKPVSQFA